MYNRRNFKGVSVCFAYICTCLLKQIRDIFFQYPKVSANFRTLVRNARMVQLFACSGDFLNSWHAKAGCAQSTVVWTKPATDAFEDFYECFPVESRTDCFQWISIPSSPFESRYD